MTVRNFLLLSCLACGAGTLAYAGPINVTFVGGEIPTGPGSKVTIPANLPALLGGNADSGLSDFAGDTLFLKFKIPDIADLLSIDSFTVTVSVADDEIDAGESADVDFALPSSNIVLASPAFTSLTLNTEVLTYSLTPDEIAQVFPTITDGNFRVRIMRDTGDFLVSGGTATIDGELAPEPSSAWLMAAALCGAGVWIARRRPSSASPR